VEADPRHPHSWCKISRIWTTGTGGVTVAGGVTPADLLTASILVATLTSSLADDPAADDLELTGGHGEPHPLQQSDDGKASHGFVPR
jgi:hypothetical protein